MSPPDRLWLDRAAALAAHHLGTTAENPTVGAILTDPAGQTSLAEAVTAPGGRPHAEPQALTAAGAAARGATLYVTLEPCNHWGRTPPCSDAVLAAGVGRVVIGLVDPDPRTAGQSVARFRAAGRDVLVLDHDPSRRLHEGFVSRITCGRPFVTAKLAVSADGMIGRAWQANVPITGPVARDFTHLQRATSDAIMVGGATANIDNPRLSVRLAGFAERKPLRVVLAGAEPLRPDLTLFDRSSSQATVVIGLKFRPPPPGVDFWPLPGAARPDLALALRCLGDRGIGRLLVEGGTALTGALLAEKLVDRFLLLSSPAVIGPGGQPARAQGRLADAVAAAGLVEVDRRPLGDDMLRTFERGA